MGGVEAEVEVGTEGVIRQKLKKERWLRVSFDRGYATLFLCDDCPHRVVIRKDKRISLSTQAPRVMWLLRSCRL